MKNKKKSKYDPLDITDLNFDKYKQLHYGNMEENEDPFNLKSLNNDPLNVTDRLYNLNYNYNSQSNNKKTQRYLSAKKLNLKNE